MSWLAQTVPGRISQTPKETGRLFALVTRTPELCSLHLTPSPKRRSFVLRGVEDDADHCRAWLTRTRLLQQDMWQAAAKGSVAARSAKASFADGLQQRVFIEHHLPVFSLLALGHSLGAYPAPHHPSAQRTCARTPILRRIGFCFFQPPPPTRCVGSPLQKMHPRPWERGTFTTPAHRARMLGDPGTRVASRRSVPRTIRANPNRRKDHGTL